MLRSWGQVRTAALALSSEIFWMELDMNGHGSTRLTVGVKQAAESIGLSPWTVRKYIATGKIKSVRIGRRVLVELSELQRHVDEGRQK